MPYFEQINWHLFGRRGKHLYWRVDDRLLLADPDLCRRTSAFMQEVMLATEWSVVCCNASLHFGQWKWPCCSKSKKVKRDDAHWIGLAFNKMSADVCYCLGLLYVLMTISD